MKLRLTEAAESDLGEIWTMLAVETSEPAATKFIAKIEKTFEPLLLFPFSGPAREQLAPGLRVAYHNPYAIYYLPSLESLTIIRVLHGARDVSAIAARGRFG